MARRRLLRRVMTPEATNLHRSDRSTEGTWPLRAPRSTWALTALVGICGVILSVAVYRVFWGREQALAGARFQLQAARQVEDIRHVLSAKLGAVRTLAGFYAGSQEVLPEEFRTFTRPLLTKYPKGIQALAWAPRVVSPEGGERFPIRLVEPGDGNEALLGLDLNSEADCRAAMERAREAGRLAAGVTTPLWDHAADARALYVMMWVHGGTETSDPSAPSPDEGVWGFVFGAFGAGDAIEEALRRLPPAGIDVQVFDELPSGETESLYAHASRLRGPENPIIPLKRLPVEPDSPLRHLERVAVADRTWAVYCTAVESHFTAGRSWGPLVALGAGLLLTGLMVAYLLLLIGRTARIEQLVAERTAQLHSISNAALDAVIMMDPWGNVAHWNPAAEKMFGYRREEILGRSVHQTLVPDRYRTDAQKGVEAFARHGQGRAVGRVLELAAVRRDGSEFPIEISLSSIRLEGQWWAVGIIRDISSRRQTQEALEKERQLLRKLLGLQERDRKLVAYEIHDGLAQQLTAAVLKLQAFCQQRDRDPPRAQQTFDDGLQLLRGCVDEARRLIGGLRPPILDQSGIVAAVEYLISEHRRDGGPEIEFSHRIGAARLAPPLEIAVFRIVQESLNNACRYSHAEKIHIDLSRVDDRLRIEVQDWGVGFDPATVAENRFGLQGIRERARLLFGHAAVESTPGQGTRIVVELPLLEETSEESE